MARYRADLIETAWNNELIYGTKPAALNKGWGIVTAGITLPDPRYEFTPFYGIGVDNRNILTHIQGREMFEGAIGTVMLCHDNSRLILGDSIGQIFNTVAKVANTASCTVSSSSVTFAGNSLAQTLTGVGAAGLVTAGQEPKYIVVISQNNTDAPLPFTSTFAYIGARVGSTQEMTVHHSPNTTALTDVGWQGKLGTSTCRAAVYSIERGVIAADDSPDGVLAPSNAAHGSSLGIRETLKQQSFTLGSKISADNGQSMTSNFMGNKVGSTTFNFAENSPVTFSINFTGQDMIHNMPGGGGSTIVKYGAVVAPAMDKVTEQPYFFSKADIKFGGVAFAKFRTLTLTINNQLDPRFYITQSATNDNRQILSEILEGRRAISIGGQLDMDDTAAGVGAGAQNGPDIKFLQYLFNQGFNTGDPNDALAGINGISLEIELKRFNDSTASTYDTFAFKLPAIDTPSTTNVGLVLNAARMPIPAPPQVHQNIDIEGIAGSMRVEIKDSTS